MKKLIAILLAALLCSSMLFACGGGSGSDTTSKSADGGNSESQDSGKTDEKPYEAVMILYQSNDNWPHRDDVMNALTELVLKDINIKCTFVPMTFGTVSQQVPLMLSGGQQIDIFNNFNDPPTQYENAYILDMMPYWDKLQGAIKAVGGEAEVKASLRDGHLLGFYPMMERCHQYGMAMRTDILEEVGYKAEDLRECDFDQATEIFKAVHEAHPEMVVMGGAAGSTPACNFQHTHTIGANSMGVLDNYGAELKVVNAFETEEFIKRVDYMKQWYDAGYIQKDIATSSDGYEGLVRAGNTFGGCCPMKPDSYAEKADQCNYPMTIFHFAENMVNAFNGAGYAIGGTSKNPEKAAELMDYIFTSREFNDMINWGVEGIDWVESDDPSKNVATYPEGMTPENATYHNSYGWAYPNQRIAHVWDNNEPDMYTRIYPEAEEASKRSKAYGFQFKNADWIEAEGAFKNIYDEYVNTIGAGAVKDPAASIKELNDKLYASGLQEYMDAQQKQLDDWAAENGIK